MVGAAETALIVPPRDIRQVIDRTAEFVARNGAEVEARIFEEERDNPKFSFIRFDDPYRGYYDRRVAELCSGVQAVPPPPEPAAPAAPPPEPEPEPQGWALHPPLTLAELEGIKLTARAVALHGQSFYEQLIEGSAVGPLAFLRPSHRLFAVFTALVEQYARVIDGLPRLAEQLKAELARPETVMQRCAVRAERQAQEFEEQKRLLLQSEGLEGGEAQLDWDNFIVLKTIDWEEESAEGRFVERPAAQLQRPLPSPAIAQPARARPQAPESAYYKCTFCGQLVRLEEYEEHHKAEIARAKAPAEKAKTALVIGTRDPAASLARRPAPPSPPPSQPGSNG